MSRRKRGASREAERFVVSAWKCGSCEHRGRELKEELVWGEAREGDQERDQAGPYFCRQ